MKTSGMWGRVLEGAAIRVKIPQMPPEELSAVMGEPPAPEDFRRWFGSGRIGSPVAAVVADSRHATLPALEDVEEAKVVFYHRDAGHTRRLPRDGRGGDIEGEAACEE